MKPCARFAFGCLTIATLALTAASLAQPQSVPRELAQRFVGAGTTIFIGELPPENRLGFAFPLPERTRVVGASALTDTDPLYDYMSLYLSSQQRLEAVKAFYRQAFRNRNWRMGQTYQQTGFLPSGGGEAVDSMTFCRSRGGNGTDVYLTLSTQRQITLIDAQVSSYRRSQGVGACDESDHREPPIPMLEAPANSETAALENLSGFNQGNGGSVIVLETRLTPEELLEHYARQLELSGWREDASADGGGVRLATYRFRDRGEAFIGTLQVVPLAGGRYLAQVTVVNP